MPRVTGSLVVSQSISSAKFVPNDRHSGLGLPWKLLNNWTSIKDFVDYFKPPATSKTPEMIVYAVDVEEEQLHNWFKAREDNAAIT